MLDRFHIDTYVEPFAGGLGAFFGIYDLLIRKKIENVVLNDINSKLIDFYIIVKEQPEQLINQYAQLEVQFDNLIPKEIHGMHIVHDKQLIKSLLVQAENLYKLERDKFNSSHAQIGRASGLLFLQNHCFNGIYRENSNGDYNTPFNWNWKKIELANVADKILAASKMFKEFNIVFLNKGFQDLEYKKNSLHYLDPPYINESGKQENRYHKKIFGLEAQKELINTIKNTNFLYSNHDSEIIIQEFLSKNISITWEKIARKNTVSACTTSRKSDKIELLITSLKGN